MKSEKNISLFEPLHTARAPLAEQLRPKIWAEFKGISRLPASLISQLEAGVGKVPSLILWGPPGSGKTTFARLVGNSYDCKFVELSAVLCGVADIRQAAVEAGSQEKQSIVFLDEIHRLNRSQQDALLPHIEKGTFSLIGATTENPSFSLNKALLSRSTLLVMEPLTEDELIALAKKAAASLEINLDDLELKLFSKASCSDGRRLCNLVELFAQSLGSESSREAAATSADNSSVEYFLNQHHILSYDRNGEDHYNIVSAFIKSMRGSDPDAALYWCFRMLEAGEDPAFVLRRMIIFASEDIGNADPRALPLAISTAEAFERMGFPEGRIPIAQCVVFLATAPKSNRSYLAMNKVLQAVKDSSQASVPNHLRNAATELMTSLGYGENYQYPHESNSGFIADIKYLPTELEGSSFYVPTLNGYEKTISDRVAFRKTLNRKGEV